MKPDVLIQHKILMTYRKKKAIFQIQLYAKQSFKVFNINSHSHRVVLFSKHRLHIGA